MGAGTIPRLFLTIALGAFGFLGCQSRITGVIRHDGKPWASAVEPTASNLEEGTLGACFERHITERKEPSGDERTGSPALGRTLDVSIRRSPDAPSSCPDVLTAAARQVEGFSFILFARGIAPARGYTTFFHAPGGYVNATVVLAPLSSIDVPFVHSGNSGIAQVIPSEQDPTTLVAVAALDKSGKLINAWTVLGTNIHDIRKHRRVSRLVELFSYKADGNYRITFSGDESARPWIELLKGRMMRQTVDVIASNQTEARMFFHCTAADRLAGPREFTFWLVHSSPAW